MTHPTDFFTDSGLWLTTRWQQAAPFYQRPHTVVMAQINTTPGDLAGNAKKIQTHLTVAQHMQADLVVFPELSLMGYPIWDVIKRFPSLVDENQKWLAALAQLTKGYSTWAAVGFVATNPADCGNPYFNALAILGEGEIRGVVHKTLLPAYSEFYDPRTFASGALDQQRTFAINGIRYGFTVCEDIWGDADFFKHPPYAPHNNVLDKLMSAPADQQPEVIINASASPSRARKEGLKQAMLAHLAKKYQRPLVYVNQVGAVDESSFDGGSRLLDAQGNTLARARMFVEQWMPCTPPLPKADSSSIHWLEPLPGLLSETPAKMFDPEDPNDLDRLYQSVCQGIRDYCHKTGFKRAVLGLSGGIDSSVTAVLLADALGPENILAVTMPSKLTPDENQQDAETLATNLGIQQIQLPIASLFENLMQLIKAAETPLTSAWGLPQAGAFTQDNAQAMSRATLLRLLGNQYRAFPIATSDKSEFYLGYATVNGDMSGALAPLGDIPKTRVFALARWLNKNRPSKQAIPERILSRPPGADLAMNPETGTLLTAEQALMPYMFADEVIWRIENLQQGYQELLEATYRIEADQPLSKAQKQLWLDKFFNRMNAAIFKWWLAPPMIITDGSGALAKTDYKHPITASRIVWQGTDEAKIRQMMEETTQQLLNLGQIH